MEGGGAHLCLLLPMSAFIHRWSFLCAGGRLHLLVPFSFTGIVFVCGRSPLLVGGRLRLRSWAFAFIRGRLPLFVGGRAVCMVSWWAFGSFVGRRHHRWSCRWWGAVLGCWWGVVVVGSWCGGGELVGYGSRPLVCGCGRSLWPFVVV